jgi:predicted RNA-binding Zn-ribbon protein involved in translation (DUF1610 family)
MRCPNCGAEMNRHAEKAIKTAHFEGSEIVAAIHYCPNCGKVEAEIEPRDT